MDNNRPKVDSNAARQESDPFPDEHLLDSLHESQHGDASKATKKTVKTATEKIVSLKNWSQIFEG